MYSNLLSWIKNNIIVIHSQILKKQKNSIKKNKILKKLKTYKEEHFLKNQKNLNDSKYLLVLFILNIF